MRKVMEAAYAKVNLTLTVTGRRADGYHTIESLFQSVSLCDKLTLEQRERGFWLNETAGIPAEENIITRADRLLRREFPNLGGVAVTLEKNIPTQAGLGGGSTDAAAYLRGMDRLYGLGLGREGLRALAAELGADVPFCLRGGTMLAQGIGEELSLLPDMPHCWVVLCKPPFAVPTKEVYQEIDSVDILEHPDNKGMMAALDQGDYEGVCAYLSNVMETVTAAKRRQIGEIKSFLAENGADGTLMSGSGPTVYGLFSDESRAKTAAKMLRRRFADTFLTETCN